MPPGSGWFSIVTGGGGGSAVLGAQRAGWFLYLLPLVSLLGGAALLGEPLSWIELLGGATVLFSVFLAHL